MIVYKDLKHKMTKGRSSQRQQFKCKCTFHKHVINFACPIKGKIENVSRTQPPRQRGETNQKPLRGLQYSDTILHSEKCFSWFTKTCTGTGIMDFILNFKTYKWTKIKNPCLSWTSDYSENCQNVYKFYCFKEVDTAKST